MNSTPVSSSRPQPVAVRQQDQRRVTVAVPVGLGHFDQGLDFGRGEVFAGAQFGARTERERFLPW
jgi:hypothetical protein